MLKQEDVAVGFKEPEPQEIGHFLLSGIRLVTYDLSRDPNSQSTRGHH